MPANVLQAKVGGPIEASTYFTYKRLFKDTMVFSEPQIKFPEGAFVLRANDDRVRPLTFACWLAEGGGTQIRHVDVSEGKWEWNLIFNPKPWFYKRVVFKVEAECSVFIDFVVAVFRIIAIITIGRILFICENSDWGSEEIGYVFFSWLNKGFAIKN